MNCLISVDENVRYRSPFNGDLCRCEWRVGAIADGPARRTAAGVRRQHANHFRALAQRGRCND